MKRVVTFGEIMMRLSPPGFQRSGQARSFDVIYGGGEANVAVALANFGVPVDYVTRLPDNELGDACLQFLRQYGVVCVGIGSKLMRKEWVAAGDWMAITAQVRKVLAWIQKTRA
jgi:sugar/nucleoside kinase (ribokinase family)